MNRLELVRFKECKFDLTARYCKKCRQIVSDPLLSCPKCNNPYDNLSPIWHIYFVMDDKDQNKNKKLDIEAIGSVIDPVIGMTIKDFLYIVSKISDDFWGMWINDFFLYFSFAIYRSYDRIQKITLPPGVNINFKKWIMPKLKNVNIDPETIDSLLIERNLKDDEEDDEEEDFNF